MHWPDKSPVPVWTYVSIASKAVAVCVVSMCYVGVEFTFDHLLAVTSQGYRPAIHCDLSHAHAFSLLIERCRHRLILWMSCLYHLSNVMAYRRVTLAFF